MWATEITAVQRSPSLALTCTVQAWTLKSSYNLPPQTHTHLTALRPDYKISSPWSGLNLEMRNLGRSHASRYQTPETTQ